MYSPVNETAMLSPTAPEYCASVMAGLIDISVDTGPSSSSSGSRVTKVFDVETQIPCVPPLLCGIWKEAVKVPFASVATVVGIVAMRTACEVDVPLGSYHM